MNIVFIAAFYPYASRPTAGVFTQQFVWAMQRAGNKCSVIHPVSILHRKYGRLPPRARWEQIPGNGCVQVVCPRYLSFGWRSMVCFHTGRLTNSSFAKAALVAIGRQRLQAEILYGHFMYPAGYAAVNAGQRMGIPSVVGVGEGEFWTLEPAGERRASRELNAATAFLANSTCIAENLTRTLAISPKKIAIFPNGVNLDRFGPCTDRDTQCRLLGIPSDTFNIGFIGPPVVQKGYPQLREAVAEMENARLILLGRGMDIKDDPRVAYAGAVPHSDVPRFLGACDIFVLPTAIEGSCNAVIEAMSCGLPIVTSDGRHMDDIVDDEVAFRVDITDVSAIRVAIQSLKDNPDRRRKMSAACLKKARLFDINVRARRVTEWMEKYVRRHRT